MPRPKTILPPFHNSGPSAAQPLHRGLVSPLPGILLSEEALEEVLAEDQSAEALFRYFWEMGYGLEEMMRGDWSRQEQHSHAARVARDALLLLYKSKPGAPWKNGYCLLIEKPDGSIEPLLVKGNEQASIVVTTEPNDAVFLSVFSTAHAEARKALVTVQPRPQSALLIFAARTAGGHILLRYHQFAPEEIKTLSLRQQPPANEV